MSHTQCPGFMLDYTEFVLDAIVFMFGDQGFLKNAWGGLIISGDIQILTSTYLYICIYVYMYIYNNYKSIYVINLHSAYIRVLTTTR